LELFSLDDAVKRLRELITITPGRVTIGIVGKPGAGKSTVSDFLIRTISDVEIAVVPMDGYHLSNKELERLQRADRKGAPDTFDVDGYEQLLKRIASNRAEDIYFPVFHREIEESIAAEGLVTQKTKVVITEGNYLLHTSGGWENIASHLTECWYIHVDDSLRLQRLVKRHIEFGKEPEAAHVWAHGTDERNADLVGATKNRAQLIINL
jgi:pantothenate kinase